MQEIQSQPGLEMHREGKAVNKPARVQVELGKYFFLFDPSRAKRVCKPAREPA